MLNESGNLIAEGLEITQELLDFALANGYKISLKSGDYSKCEVSHRGRYNKELLKQIHLLYLIGEFYPNRYHKMLMFTTADHIISVFNGQKLPKLPKEEFMRMYKNDIRQAQRDSCMESTGAPHPNLSEKSQRVRRERSMKKWGVEHPNQNKEVKARGTASWKRNEQLRISELKSAFTCFDKIGQVHYMKDENFKSAITDKLREGGGIGLQRPGARDYAMQCMIDKLGTDKPSTLDEVRLKITEAMNTPEVRSKVRETKASKDERYARILEFYEDFNRGELDEEAAFKFIDENFKPVTKLVHLTNLGLRKKYRSHYELKIASFIGSLELEYIHSYYDGALRNKNGNKFEVDIFIPAFKLSIEVNGLYFHSKDGINPEFVDDFHNYKMRECRKNGIMLLSFTDYEIDNYQEFVKTVIMMHLGLIDRREVLTHINDEMLSDLQFEKDEILHSLNYSITDSLDAFNSYTKERTLGGFTYIDCGISKTNKEVINV